MPPKIIEPVIQRRVGRRQRRSALSKVQSVDQRMHLGMLCRLSPTADVPSHTSGAAMCHKQPSDG